MSSGTRGYGCCAAYHRDSAGNLLDKDKRATIEAIMRPIVKIVRQQEFVLCLHNTID
jgi:hypothetical protein